MKKIIGIIGGMGPLATADLFEKIIRATDAARDQDFPHVIVDCNTDIPDRTAAILMGGEDITKFPEKKEIFRLYPDGSGEEQEIELILDDRKLVLTMSPLTGRIMVGNEEN